MHAQLQSALQPLGEPETCGLAESDIQEIERELAQLRVQRMRIEQRERVLLQALGGAGAARFHEVCNKLAASGVPVEHLLRSTVDAGGPKSGLDNSKLAQSFVRVAPLKFRHPDQPALVWSGRGKTPLWIRELERAGRLDEARLNLGPDGAPEQTP